MPELIARDVCYTYGRSPVLDGVSLTARSGKVTAIVGPNGSGKSTLLWILAGLRQPTSGQVVVAGDAGRPLRLGMVFQPPALWEHLSVQKHLELVLGRLPWRERRQRVSAMLEQVDLARLAARRPTQLSGGERQRLALARALAVDPDFLLLDEPLAHLDGPRRASMFQLLSDVLDRTEAGVLLVTHAADEALRLAHHLALLRDGRVVQDGSPAEVYDNPTTLEAARLLGPAFVLSGRVRDGALFTDDGTRLLTGVRPEAGHSASLILRPHEVTIEPCPQGPIVVRRVTYGGDHWLVDVALAQAEEPDLASIRMDARAAPPTVGSRVALRLGRDEATGVR